MEENQKEIIASRINSTEEILYKQVELLAEKSKDCSLEELRENIETLINVLDYTFKY